jgi:hypothetical protein
MVRVGGRLARARNFVIRLRRPGSLISDFGAVPQRIGPRSLNLPGAHIEGQAASNTYLKIGNVSILGERAMATDSDKSAFDPEQVLRLVPGQ